MRCSEPRWRLEASMAGSPMDSDHGPIGRVGRRGVADESVEDVGRQGGRAPDGAVPHRGHGHPDGAVLHFLRRVRAASGRSSPRSAGPTPRSAVGSSPAPDPRPAGARHVGDLGAHGHLPAQRQQFVYFFQPIMRTVVTAAVFALSVAFGRPLIARFAEDFCPLTPDATEPPRGRRGCSAGSRSCGRRVNAVAAAATLDIPADRAGRGLRRYGDGLGVDHHVQRGRAHGVRAVRMARKEGLHTAVAPTGRLHAYVTPIVLG